MDIDKIVGSKFFGVISITENEQTIFQKAYGYADLANKYHNEADTKFGTASAGKVFVSTAILQLLNHTSGTPDNFNESVMNDYEDLWRDFPNYRFRSSKDLIPLFIDKPMMYPKGEKFQYNNTGYVVFYEFKQEHNNTMQF